MTPNEEERGRPGFPLMASTDQFESEKDETTNKQRLEVQERSTVGDERSDFEGKAAFRSSPAADQKAAKIQRLKSGFRICKPQGTFLWPNMVNNYSSPCSNMLSPQPDQVLVPTPPSVSSSTASAPPQLPYHHLLHPSPPVKPLAERGAVAVSLPPKGTNIEDVVANTISTTTVINLRNVPSSPPTHDLPLVSSGANIKIWESCLYGTGNAVGYVQQQQNVCCSSSASSLASEVGNWLALSAPRSGSDEST
ncbi:protein DYAD-like [Dorcoceras hygrometricum]|uniref:Protein DYAD-like n=1 Tax=Dorcoceras hygrometricum TaxID=472368 RepID=A0A2Z7CJY1_9LAMI|nr:protein DYAD-like [Dorcoceras hygrometricum]